MKSLAKIKKMNVVGVIPARYESTRLQHKLLRKICGKTLLQWSWENARQARNLDKLIIACDDVQLQKEAQNFGAECVMTSTKHLSGTDRIAESIREIDTKAVINIQADEPLIHPAIIDNLAQEIFVDPNIAMVTVRKKITENPEINNPNVVKVVCDRDGLALYFSRFSIPYCRNSNETSAHYKHLGIYAYTKDFLYTFKNLPASNLEKCEKLEQLRALEAGYMIKVIETQFDSVGVDTEEDLYRVKKILHEQ